jgi:hypothetical protein
VTARSGGERSRPDDTSDVEGAPSGAPSLPSTGSGPPQLASQASPLTSLDDLPGHPEQSVPERRWFTRRREQTPVANDNRTAARRPEDTAAAARAIASESPDP